MATPTLCISCGQPVTDPPRLNVLPSGEPCPACRARALDAAPSILPSTGPRPLKPETEPVAEPTGEPAGEAPFGDYPEPA